MKQFVSVVWLLFVYVFIGRSTGNDSDYVKWSHHLYGLVPTGELDTEARVILGNANVVGLTLPQARRLLGRPMWDRSRATKRAIREYDKEISEIQRFRTGEFAKIDIEELNERKHLLMDWMRSLAPFLMRVKINSGSTGSLSVYSDGKSSVFLEYAGLGLEDPKERVIVVFLPAFPDQITSRLHMED